MKKSEILLIRLFRCKQMEKSSQLTIVGGCTSASCLNMQKYAQSEIILKNLKFGEVIVDFNSCTKKISR